MSVGTNEKILLNYLHEIEYNNDTLNAIGANTSLTLRTIETPSTAATKYVKKFGNAYTITDITAGSVTVPRSDGGGVNKWWYEFYDFDTHTLMATVKDENGASAFVDGAALASPASGIYVKVVWKSGTVTINAADRINVDTDIDVGGRNVRLSAESFTSGEMLFYFAYSSSSYYMDDINDQSAMYGGHRVAGGGSLRQPYYTIQAAIDAVAAAGAPFDNVTVLDSETYDEDIDADVAGMFLQAALGQTPTITRGIGARVSREQVNQGNNADTAYVSGALAMGGTGTYQDPYTTITAAIAGIGARTNIHIMDSGTYTENITLNAAITLEPLYGKLPIMVSTGDIITQTHADASISGITVSSGTNCFVCAVITPLAVVMQDCSLSNATNAGITIGQFDTTFYCYRTRIFSCLHGVSLQDPAVGDITNLRLFYCYVYNNTNGGIVYAVSANSAAQLNYNNCVVYGNEYGMKILSGGMPGSSGVGIITNSTVVNNNIGVYEDATLANVTAQVFNSIVYHNTTWDFQRIGVASVGTFEWSCYFLNSGFTDNGNNITSDPRFCKRTSPFKFGLSANSEAIKADSASDDMGAHLRIIEINESDITINGFIIDGQSAYNEALFIVDVADHTGTIIIWNTIQSFNGIALDPDDDDVDTDTIIKNNIIRDCGNGIKLSYGGNTVQENLIYNNTIYGIYAQRTGDSIIHNTITGSQYGLYLDTTVSGMTVRDNIFSQNSLNDIYSNVNITVIYNSIDGALTGNVTALADTNVLASPLFVDISDSNYNLKVIENGFFVESPCKDKSSDSPVQDIGAWNTSRSVESEAWRKYQLEWNPRKLDPEYNGKGVTKFENALGFTKMFEKSHLRILPFQWNRTQASTEELWKKIQYLSSLVPDRDQGRTEDQCRIRVNPLPSQLIISGTAATISAATKTILDTNLDLTEDELKGYWASVKFLSGTGMTIDAALKTGTVAGTPWTVNEHVGRYVHDSGYYYRVLSNTLNVVTLSDANNTLTSGTITWAFEKFFKMIKTENQILHLEDENGELPTGSFDYYCDFIEMHVVKPNFKTLQERFYWLQETWKTGFNLFLEEL